MYSYFYDDFVNDKKYEKILGSIEAQLTDLGIYGRIDRLSAFKSVKGLLAEAVRKGAKTIVVVGNDNTIQKVTNVYPDFSVILGILPLGSPNFLANFLGIPTGEAACEVLSRRIIEKVDMGEINSRYFLSNVSLISNSAIKIECEGRYTVRPENLSEIQISNFFVPNSRFDSRSRRWHSLPISNPQDGFLDLYVSLAPSSFKERIRNFLTKKRKISIFPLRHLSLASEKPFIVNVDGVKLEGSSFDIKVTTGKLGVITGKSRKIISSI